MATQTIRIVIQEQGSRQAAASIGGIGRSAQGSSDALRFLKAALASVGIGSLVKQYVDLSNTYQTLQNRIRLVTSSQTEQTAVTRALLDTANSTYTSLQDTAELYARLAFNTRSLGLTQAQVIQATRTLNQAVLLSGAGAREASNAIIQFSQGLASGTLRGDELRSVMEQLPYVADLIASGMDVSRDALRRLGSEGEITSKIIIEKVLAASEKVNAEATKISPTIAQAFNTLGNSVSVAVGEFNAATGASASFAKAIIGIGRGMEDVADIAIAFVDEFGSLMEAAGGLIEDAFGIRIEDAKFSFRGFLQFIGSFIDTTTGLFIGMGQGIVTHWTVIFDNLKGIGERVINGAAVVIEAVVNSIIAGINKSIQVVADSVNTLIDLANEASNVVGGGDILTRVDFGKLVELNLGRVNETPFKQVGEEVGNAFVSGFEGATGARNFVDDVLRKADQRRARRQAEGRDLGGKVRNPQEGRNVQTANDILILQLAEQLKMEERLQIVRGSSSTLQIAQAEALEKFNKQVKNDKITLNDGQREELELMVRANAERKVRNDLDKQVRDFTKDMEDQLRLLTLSTQSREVEADLLKITNSYKEAGIEIDAATVANLRSLRSEVQQRTNDEKLLNGIFGDRQRVLEDMAALERLRQAETSPSRRRGIEREQVQQRISSRQGDPTLLAGFSNGLDQLYLKVSDVAGGIEQAMTSAFSSAEDALVSFVQTGKFNFSGLVDSILADITRLLARQAILALFNALSGGTSGAFGGVLTALAGAKAEGGPVIGGRTYLVGERGPELFQPNQSGTIVPNSALQGHPPQANVTVINVMDPAMVSAALNDPANQQVIVNVIGRNRHAVNQRLGNG